MIAAPFISRQAWFPVVGSTSDEVRTWLLAGEPEVCLAVADEQSAGRGRSGRTWQAPAGRALLLSLGFRPTWLAPDRAWQLAAVVSLAMADAAEEVAGLPMGAIRLKWPNDMVVEDAEDPAIAALAGPAPSGAAAGATQAAEATEVADPANGTAGATGPGYRKLAGVLGESSGLGSADPTVIIGIGTNADWPVEEFPPALAGEMTSLRAASHGRPVDRALLLDAFLSRLEVRVEALRGGRFDVADWQERQLSTGRVVRLDWPDGRVEDVRALGVDTRTGALVVADPDATDGERRVMSGEIRHLRLPGPATV